MKQGGDGLPTLAVLAIVVALVQGGCSGTTPPDSGKSGQELFRIHCSGCHPNGGNVIYPQKTLDRMTLAANGITGPEGIVAVMRKPGRGMKEFDRRTVSERDALKIAEYVLATFR